MTHSDLIQSSFSTLIIGPASPIIEDVAPIEGGLNISWKSDVTSKQDQYVVVYVRNDTGTPVNIETREPRVTLTNLYPGAGYEIKVKNRSMFCEITRNAFPRRNYIRLSINA